MPGLLAAGGRPVTRGSLCPSCDVGTLEEHDGALVCSDETCGAVVPAASEDRIKTQIEYARERIARAAEAKADLTP